MRIEDLLVLPWTWSDPTPVTEDGDTHWEMRVQELPEFFVAAETENEVRREAGLALRAYLESFLDNSQVPPLPQPSWQIVLPASGGQQGLGGLVPPREPVPSTA